MYLKWYTDILPGNYYRDSTCHVCDQQDDSNKPKLTEKVMEGP